MFCKRRKCVFIRFKSAYFGCYSLRDIFVSMLNKVRRTYTGTNEKPLFCAYGLGYLLNIAFTSIKLSNKLAVGSTHCTLSVRSDIIDISSELKLVKKVFWFRVIRFEFVLTSHHEYLPSRPRDSISRQRCACLDLTIFHSTLLVCSVNSSLV